MRNHGVVLSKDGEDDGRGARGEVVEKASGKGPEKESQDGGRQDARQQVRNDEEGLSRDQYTVQECIPAGKMGGAYGIFPRSPEALHHTHIVESDDGGQDLSRVSVAELENKGTPWLMVGPKVCADVDVEVMLHIKKARSHGGGDEADNERSRHGHIGKGHGAGRGLSATGT